MSHRFARFSFVIVFLAASVAYVLPFRQPDCNTASHFALVQTLAASERSIDRIHGESCDVSWTNGHFYSNKAPGLALVTTPWYLLLRATGAMVPNPAARSSFPVAMRAIPRRDLWLMGLWGAVLPALGALLVARSLAERFEPQSGPFASATLAFGTLLLPFASLFFSHALAALLALSAFALIVTRRSPLAAGVVAGFGIVVEYPLGLLAVVLGGYLLACRDFRRFRSYAVGMLIGVAPLFVFNTWAFGSPLHLSYVGAVLVPGITGHDVLGANSTGFFGVGWPRPHGAFEVLVGKRGLLSVAPVLLLVPVGLAVLWRSGRRREASLIVAIGGLFLVYNFGYYSPLGGATPGPRLLVCVLGIAAVALAPLYRVAPFTAHALLLPSAVSLLAADMTQPLISGPFDTGDWWEWLRGSHYTATIIRPASHGWLGAAPIAAAVLGAIAVVGVSVVPAGRRDARAAFVGIVVWLVCLLVAPTGLRSYAAAAGSVTAIAVFAGEPYARLISKPIRLTKSALRSLSPLAWALWAVVLLLVVDLVLRLT